MPKFYCDYCDIFLTHDSLAVRKAHNSGWKHKTQVQNYYSALSQDKVQDVMTQIAKAYEGRGGIPVPRPPMPMQFPGQGQGMPPSMPMPPGPPGFPGQMPPQNSFPGQGAPYPGQVVPQMPPSQAPPHFPGSQSGGSFRPPIPPPDCMF